MVIRSREMKKCPTALKILNELNRCECNDTIFNTFGNLLKKREVRKALRELRKLNYGQSTNS